MKYICKVNVWFYLMPLIAGKVWTTVAAGAVSAVVMALMFILSVFALIHAESRVRQEDAVWQLVLLAIYSIFVGLIFWGIDSVQEDWGRVKNAVPLKLLPEFLVTAFSAAVLEEIVFRKLLLRSLLDKMSKIKAILLSSFIFYVCHFSIFITIIISGIFYASLALRFNSIMLATIIHTFYNLLGDLAKSVEKIPESLSGGRSFYQLIRGGDALSHFAFIAFYFAMMKLFSVISDRRRRSVADSKASEILP